jgi:hypothetical protein
VNVAEAYEGGARVDVVALAVIDAAVGLSRYGSIDGLDQGQCQVIVLASLASPA